jgi:hypothetical protein
VSVSVSRRFDPYEGMVVKCLNVFFHPGASDDHRKAQFALAVNVCALFFVVTLIFIYHTETAYFRFGPSDTLSVVSVQVNSGARYAAVVLVLALLGVADVLVDEIGTPVLGFRIYNPFAGTARDPIVQFSRLELQLMGNAMYLVSHLRYVFAVVATVTQVDLALWTVLFKEGTSVFTVYYLLHDKKFMTLADYKVAHPEDYAAMADVFLDVENRGSHSSPEEGASPCTRTSRTSRASRTSRTSHRTVAFRGEDGADDDDDESPMPAVALPPPAARHSPPAPNFRRATTSSSLLTHVTAGHSPSVRGVASRVAGTAHTQGSDDDDDTGQHHPPHWENPNGMYAAAMSWRGPHMKPML